MLGDHVQTVLRATLTGALPGVGVYWVPLEHSPTYPYATIEPEAVQTSRLDRLYRKRQQVTVTVLAGAPGATVAVHVGGRYLTIAHTGDASTTAQALQGTMPAHWTVGRAGAVLTVTGADVYGGAAYEGATVSQAVYGDFTLIDWYRHEARFRIQVRHTLANAYGAQGALQLALNARARVASLPVDNYRVAFAADAAVQPIFLPDPDGRRYTVATFRVSAAWAEPEALPATTYVDAAPVTVLRIT